MKKPTNIQIAELLERIAEVLDVEDANPFRVRAYREGATSIRYTDSDVADLVKHNQMDELMAVPNIGEGIAAIIKEYVTSGQSSLLQNLEAQAGPEAALVQVPGIGKELAERIVKQIHVKSLPDLETAAHDGRLETVKGFGHRRVEGVQAALAGMLSQSARANQQNRTANGHAESHPSVTLLLDIDNDYRKRAGANDLPKIAPRRFNPNNEAWLPVLHTKRAGWTFSALYSNTARAHELDMTHDWVVIYYENDTQHGQNTIVTETQGSLKGKRVVRGRTAENLQYYSAKTN